VRGCQPDDDPAGEPGWPTDLRGGGRRPGLRSGDRPARQRADQHRRPARRPRRWAGDLLGAWERDPAQGHDPGGRGRRGGSTGVTGAGRRTATPLVAWGLAALAVLSAAVTAVLVVLNRGSIHSLDGATPTEVVMPVSFALVGGLVASRQRKNPIGWLFLFMAIDQGLAGAAYQWFHLAVTTRPGPLPGASWALWWFNWS